MQSDITDYRNGKYQGPTNINKQRHGLGIFIDDDLAFHISHWQFNKINGPSLIYFSHGKYMYGDWKDNQPHGLTVFRTGDTVLLSKFIQGLPSERCLLIFQRYNFACVLAEQNQQWRLLQSGPIPSHNALLKYIDSIGLKMPDHYFSLTKFACHYTQYNKMIKTFPYLTNYCYFGFLNGLGIVFNSNNGVVSVGLHRNNQLCEFGGKFQGVKKAEEGNFQSKGEIITYQENRPQHKIYGIYQNLHKKAINFHNLYFDSKSKVFINVQKMLRGKLQEIAQQGMQNKLISTNNLNDSLQFHDYDEEESMKNYQNRERMFSPPKKSMEKSRTSMQRSSSIKLITSRNDNRNSKFIYRPSGTSKARQVESKYQEVLDSPPCQVDVKVEDRKIGSHFIQQSKNKTEQSNKKSLFIETSDITSHAHKYNIDNPSKTQIPPKDNPRKIKEAVGADEPVAISEFYRKKYLDKKQNQPEAVISKIQPQIVSIQKSPTFKCLAKQVESKYKYTKDTKQSKVIQKSTVNQQSNVQKDVTSKTLVQETQGNTEIGRSKSKNKKIDISALPRPSYQQIQERRKRVLRQYKQLNELNEPFSAQKQTTPEPQPVKSSVKMRKDSVESSFGYIPLSITPQKQTRRQLTPSKKQNCVPMVFKKTIDTTYKVRQPDEVSTPLKEKPESNRPQGPQLLKSFKRMNESNNKETRKLEEQTQKKSMQKLDSKDPIVTVASSHQNSVSPSRQKRTYVYLFQ